VVEVQRINDAQDGSGSPSQPSPLQVEFQQLLAQTAEKPVSVAQASPESTNLTVPRQTADSGMPLPDVTFSERWNAGNPGRFAAPKLCPSSPTYDQLIEKSVRNIYDPSTLRAIPDLKTRYNCLIANEFDAMKYANEMLKATNDRFNTVIMPADARTVERNRAGKKVDIGLGTFRFGDKLFVDRVTPGGNAEAGGMQVGDIITHIGGTDVGRLTDEQVQSRLNGDVTTLGVKVLRDGKQVEVKVPRAEREVPPVVARLLPDNTLYLRIENMDSATQPDQVRAEIAKYPNAESYVVDLRGNLGGLFDNGLKLASIFMDKGKLLTMSERLDSDPADPKYRTTHFILTPNGINKTTSMDPSVQPESQLARMRQVPKKPVMVLVNEMTASSAEIMAVALQENNAATLIGTRTYGKGNGQTIFSGMPGGSSLKVTSFRFLSPNGKWLGDGNSVHDGIQPNVKSDRQVDRSLYGTGLDEQLNVAIELAKKVKQSKPAK